MGYSNRPPFHIPGQNVSVEYFMAVSSTHAKRHFVKSIAIFFFGRGGGGGVGVGRDFLLESLLINKRISLVVSSHKCAHLFCVPYFFVSLSRKGTGYKITVTLSVKTFNNIFPNKICDKIHDPCFDQICWKNY